MKRLSATPINYKKYIPYQTLISIVTAKPGTGKAANDKKQTFKINIKLAKPVF